MQGTLRSSNQNLFKLFLLCSFIIHVLFLVAKAPSISITNILKNEELEEKIIKIKFKNALSKVKKQIVQTELTQSNNLKPQENAFLGKKNNTVDRQTKSASVGVFKQAGVGKKNATQSKESLDNAVERVEKLRNLKFSDLAMKSAAKVPPLKRKRSHMIRAAKGLKNGSTKSRGLGQTNDYIEDIPLGDFTKLNTQEFEFYGFYHRIRQKLEQFWGSNIQEQAEKMIKTGRAIASDTNHITSLEIFLNSSGEIVDVNINSTSGVRELDNAAIKTFNQAGPFPNPPKGMLRNGRAKIKWSFVVNT